MGWKKDLKQRVRAGAEYLDEHLTEKWPAYIDPEGIDMARIEYNPKVGECRACIVSQLFGSYDKGLNLLGIDDGDWEGCAELGFTAPPDIDDQSICDDYWKRLDKEWAKLVEKRQEEL